MLGAPCTKMEPHDRHEWTKNDPSGESRRVWCAGEGWSEHDITVWRAGFDEAQRQRNETARPDDPAIINNPDTPLTDFQRRVLSILEESAEVYKERSAVYKDNFRTVGRVMYALFPDGRPGLQFPEDYDRWHIFELVIVKLTRYANNYDTPHEDSLLDMLPYLGILGSLDEEHRECNPAASDQTTTTQAPISTDIPAPYEDTCPTCDRSEWAHAPGCAADTPAPSKGSGFRDPMDGRRFADWYDQAQGSRWDFRNSVVTDTAWDDDTQSVSVAIQPPGSHSRYRIHCNDKVRFLHHAMSGPEYIVDQIRSAVDDTPGVAPNKVITAEVKLKGSAEWYDARFFERV